MKKIVFVVDEWGKRIAAMAGSDLRDEFHFVGFRNTSTAIEVLNNSIRPNLVILADEMPDMKSADFLDALRQKSIRVPVVMVGSTPLEGQPEDSAKKGACHYVQMSGDGGMGYEVMQAVRKYSA